MDCTLAPWAGSGEACSLGLGLSLGLCLSLGQSLSLSPSLSLSQSLSPSLRLSLSRSRSLSLSPSLSHLLDQASAHPVRRTRLPLRLEHGLEGGPDGRSVQFWAAVHHAVVVVLDVPRQLHGELGGSGVPRVCGLTLTWC